MPLVNNIRNVRIERHLLQSDCAKKLGVSTRYFSNIERYNPERIQYGKLISLSKFLNAPISDLIISR